jgi:GntR family transcriptional regulator, transcriptional repressor for pyruvate dehydrogenase complex
VATAKRTTGKTREKPQQIADELRALIVSGVLSEGDQLGHEPDLVERFGVSRPSLREALRILEAEGLITVVRGVHGGVIVHMPDERMTARTAAVVLQARNVSLADVFEARSMIEPMAARAVAGMRNRKAAVAALNQLIDAEDAVVEDPEAYAVANATFHETLVVLAKNRTIAIVAEMLNEVVVRAVAEISQADGDAGSVATRRRGNKSQRRLVELIEAGAELDAEEHWRTHMTVIGKVMLGQEASTVVDLLDHH